MYSYREYIELQRKCFMTDDEKIEKRNLEAMRFMISEHHKVTRPEPTVTPAEVNIENDKTVTGAGKHKK